MQRVDLTTTKSIEVRAPQAPDGLAIHNLVKSGGALDANSLYCNVLMAHHFAETSGVALSGGKVIGFVTAYCPPNTEDTLFIWQIGVDESWQGRRVARQMVLSVLDRESCQHVQNLTATITPSNKASWKFFENLAGHLGAQMAHAPLFDCNQHFGGRHESEEGIRIGPFSRFSHLRAATA